MLKSDTLNGANSKLLTKQMDLNNYIIHRRHVVESKPLNKFGNGDHIKPINTNQETFNRKERLNEIDRENLRLFWAIKGTMTRKVWSKTRAEKRKEGHTSPRIFGRPSWPTTEAKQEDIASGQQNWRNRKELRRMSKQERDTEQ